MKKILTIVFIFYASAFGWAQTKDTIKYNDEMTTEELKNLLLESYKKMEEQRRDDSIRKGELKADIELLNNAEQNKKEKLLEILNQLEKEDSIKYSKWNERITKLRQSSIGYPVAPFGDTLFLVFTKLGAQTPNERALSISDKIISIYKKVDFHPDSFKTQNTETAVDVQYGKLIIVAISDWDAAWFNKDKQTVADSVITRIRNAVVHEKEANSLENQLMQAAKILLVLFIVILLFYLINWISRRLAKWMTINREHYLKGINLKNYQLLSSQHELALVLRLINILKWTFVIVLIYISLPVLFSILPFTRSWASAIFHWTLTPAKNVLHAVIQYIPNLITIIVVYIITRYIIRAIAIGVKEIENGRLTIDGFHSDWARTTFQIVRFILYAFMFVAIFPYLPGSNSPVFKGVSVFLGVLFSLGSTSAIGNIVSGLVITYMRPFQIGDRIKIGDVTGDVIEKTMLVTRIRTIKNEDVTIPNSTVLSGHTINYSSSSKQPGLILNTTVTIGYDAPWRTVHQLLIDAATATDFVLKEPLPFVLQTSLDDFYVSYQINAYTNEPNKQVEIYSALHQKIQDKFNAAGVEIMSPHYRNVRDGNSTTVPAEYLPKDYKAPAFRVDKTGDIY